MTTETVRLNASRGCSSESIGAFLGRISQAPTPPVWTWLEPFPTRDPLPGFAGLWRGWCPAEAAAAKIHEARVCWPGATLHLVARAGGFDWVLLAEPQADPGTGLQAEVSENWDGVERESAKSFLAGPNQRARQGVDEIPGDGSVNMVLYRREGMVVGWSLES